MSMRCSMSTRLAISPLMFIPKMAFAGAMQSSALLQNLMPPALPLPPINTCALTTDGAGRVRMIAIASSTDAATRPGGTGIPALAKSSFPWYSSRRISFSSVRRARRRTGRRLQSGFFRPWFAVGGAARAARRPIVSGPFVQPAEQLARDDDVLHLGRPLVDLGDLGVAVVAFGGELGRVSVPTQDLQAFVGVLARGGRCEQLRLGRCIDRRRALVAQPCRAIEQ